MKIRNTTIGDIHVTTEAGRFSFPAGTESVDLSEENVLAVQEAGAVYFRIGELVEAEDAPEEVKPAKSDKKK